MSSFIHKNRIKKQDARRRPKRVSLIFTEKIGKILIPVLLILPMLLCGCTGSASETATSYAYVMDTQMTQQWYGEKAEETCQQIEAAMQELEGQISLYREDSEISKINAAAGKEYVQVSDTVYDLIKRTKELSEESGGVFDLTIAPLSILWDVTGESPKVPSDQEIAKAQSKIDYRKVLLNEEERSVMLAEEGMMLDLGGSAKGMAAGLMRDIAETNGSQGYVSIGGNVLVVGKKPNGDDIEVGLRDVLGEQNDYYAILRMDGYTMATSSASDRYFEQDGVRYHHILDPFTGYPGESDLLSVGVVSEDGLLADTLSTTIFLKGSECLAEYMNRNDCMVIAVTQDREVVASEKLWDMLTVTDTQTYTFLKDQ